MTPRNITAGKPDGNQAEIVSALRELGATVLIISGVGHNAPDLVVGYRGRNFLMEVKQPGEDLRPGQQDWHDQWAGRVCVVRSPEDAIMEIGRR